MKIGIVYCGWSYLSNDFFRKGWFYFIKSRRKGLLSVLIISLRFICLKIGGEREKYLGNVEQSYRGYGFEKLVVIRKYFIIFNRRFQGEELGTVQKVACFKLIQESYVKMRLREGDFVEKQIFGFSIDFLNFLWDLGICILQFIVKILCKLKFYNLCFIVFNVYVLRTQFE